MNYVYVLISCMAFSITSISAMEPARVTEKQKLEAVAQQIATRKGTTAEQEKENILASYVQTIAKNQKVTEEAVRKAIEAFFERDAAGIKDEKDIFIEKFLPYIQMEAQGPKNMIFQRALYEFEKQ